MSALPVKSAALQRCLNSPYLSVDDNKPSQVQNEFAAARDYYQQAVSSFKGNDEATGLKRVWSVMFRSARALAYKAGYKVEQLHCLEVVLLEHYPNQITQDDIGQLRQAQELLGPPDAALNRAQSFMKKASALA